MDLVCDYDLDLFGAELDDPLAELAQDILHIFLEPLGSNIDDPTRGLGLPYRLSGAVDPFLTKDVEQQLLRDPRISAVRAEVTTLSDTAFTLSVSIEADGGELGLVFDSVSGQTTRVS